MTVVLLQYDNLNADLSSC